MKTTFPAKLIASAAIVLCASTPAFAAEGILLDFEGPTSFSSIGEFYNGGADSAGQLGPALGVSFSGDALAFANDELGPYFSHAPSPLGVMAPVGADATLNVAAGFTTGLSLFYAASAKIDGAVQIWSELNGQGTLLASIDLGANASAGCSDSPFCHFDQVIKGFAGTAHSVTFGNAANAAAFDNVVIGAVPEPASMALLLAGAGGLALIRRRRG